MALLLEPFSREKESLDPIDKAIVRELIKNNRRTYAYLGEAAGVSSKTARMRVEKLVEDGTIHEFMVLKSLKMSEYDLAFIILRLDGSIKPDVLIKNIHSNPMVYVSAPLTTGDFILHAEYQGSEGLNDLGTFLRSQKGVAEVEIHPTVRDRGGAIELTSGHKRLLSFLMDDARMSISELTKRTGFSARRVKRLVEEMTASRGIQFSIKYNPNNEDEISFIIKINFDNGVTSGKELESRIEQDYPREYFRSHFSATQAVLFSVFNVQHLTEMEKMSNEIQSLSGVSNTEVLLYYNAIILDPPRRQELREKLISEGFIPS